MLTHTHLIIRAPAESSVAIAAVFTRESKSTAMS
jgi:hypothetical protein